MEHIISADSPLAQYLLEGTGEATSDHHHHITSPHPPAGDQSPSPSTSQPSRPPSPHAAPSRRSTPSRLNIRHSQQRSHDFSFAPARPGPIGPSKRLLPRPLRLDIPKNGPVARIHEVCSRAVNSRLGRADNSRFLEHFRYILVASQLLSDQHAHGHGYGYGNPPRTGTPPNDDPSPSLDEFKARATSLTGALLTAATSFAVVWLVHWSRAGKLGGFSKGRALFVVSIFVGLAMVLYAYARRQWLQNLRQTAVASASSLVTNLQAFDASTSAALVLVQEVELVSRGYKLSTPMPPISRLDDGMTGRRCARIRRCLKGAFAAAIPPFLDACSDLRDLITEDDLDKYLDVYDISFQDIQEAYAGFSTSEFEDTESLKALRILQARLTILRRVALSALLSLEADGGKPDFSRWRTAVDTMDRLAVVSGDWAEKMNVLLDEEQEFAIPVPSTPLRAKDPEREKFRTQIRKLGSLSSGIRGLQAKLQILREESTKSIEEADDLCDLGPRLLYQYDSIGADLRSLVQAWEMGKSSLTLNLDRRESRRISQASSGLRSPVPSLGGLTAVDEAQGGSPFDALRALNGEPSLHGPSSAESHSPSMSNSDEEIFEAIAVPKTRQFMTREQRIARLKEESDRMSTFKDRREREGSLLKELESVMANRPSPYSERQKAILHRKRNTIAIPGPLPNFPGGRISSL